MRPAPSGWRGRSTSPVMPRDLVRAPADPGRVVGVGDRELGVRVVPGAVEEACRRCPMFRSLSRSNCGAAGPPGAAGRRTRSWARSGRSAPRLRSLITIASRLSKLTSLTWTPYLSAKLLLQSRVHVLGPVVDQQVAVDLRLRRPRPRPSDRSAARRCSRPGAEAVGAERRPRLRPAAAARRLKRPSPALIRPPPSPRLPSALPRAARHLGRGGCSRAAPRPPPAPAAPSAPVPSPDR